MYHFSEMMEIGTNEISPDFSVQPEQKKVTESEAEMICEQTAQSEIGENEQNTDGNDVEMADPKNAHPEIIDLGSPFSEEAISPQGSADTDSENEHFRGSQSLGLQRSKKQSFVFGDSSEEESSDEVMPEDLAMIDDSCEKNDNFCHASLHHKLSIEDESQKENKILEELPLLRVSLKERQILPKPVFELDNLAKNRVKSPIRTEIEIKRASRKRLRTLKISKQRKNVAKRAKILFL